VSESNGSGLGRIHYRVTLMDGTQLVAHILNTDLLRWDKTAAKHSWPKYDVTPMTFATFLSWAALRRTGAIDPDVTWEKFSEEQCADVTAIDAEGNPLREDAEDTDTVNPTPSAVGRG
jgi:hypothetical protein